MRNALKEKLMNQKWARLEKKKGFKRPKDSEENRKRIREARSGNDS